MTSQNTLFDQPSFADILADELAVAGLPSELDDLGRSGRDAVAAVELSVRAMMALLLAPGRNQIDRRVVTATLAACGTYAGTCFGVGDAVTLDCYALGEQGTPEGTVLAVDGRTCTVRWADGDTGCVAARDLRHDHGLRWYPDPPRVVVDIPAAG